MAKETMNLLVNRIHDRHLVHCASKYLRGRSIDIGCAGAPYRKILSPFVDHYLAVDHAGQPDVFATAYAIPVKECSFDSAICTAVLEHLEEPEQALKEAFRI